MLVVGSRASGDGNDSAGLGASPIPTTPLCADVAELGLEVDSDLESSGLYVTVLYDEQRVMLARSPQRCLPAPLAMFSRDCVW